MAVYEVCTHFDWAGPLTDRAAQVCRMFGLTLDRLTGRAAVHACRVEIRPGDIVYLTGPSGAGKSVLLRELQRQVPAAAAVNLDHIELPADRTVIDCFDTDIVTGLRLLSAVGLSDVFSVLSRLARALAAGRPFVFADEFCSGLDPITAATVAFHVHQFAKRTRTTLVLASSRDDVLLDLAPDVLVIKDFSGPAQVIYPGYRRDGA
jgi:ABC-type ATPase with predicted acetyltransferase domain